VVSVNWVAFVMTTGAAEAGVITVEDRRTMAAATANLRNIVVPP
jgi:hypothetical protein